MVKNHPQRIKKPHRSRDKISYLELQSYHRDRNKIQKPELSSVVLM